jgi:hypothetical protein
MDEVCLTRDLLERLADRSVTLFRPPHGKLTVPKLVRLWMGGWSVVLWNVDPKDFQCTSPQELATQFQRRLIDPGDVVLLHDTFPYAANVLPMVIAAARERGVSFIPIQPSRRHSRPAPASQACAGGVLEG